MMLRRVLRSGGLALVVLAMGVCASRATPFSGFVTSDTTWSGTVSVTGDVVIVPSAHLTILAGTRVYMKANQSDYDDVDGIPDKCDVIVRGALTIAGGMAPGDSVFFASNPIGGTPLPGDWGYIFFVPISADEQSSITGCTFTHGSRDLYLYLSSPPIAHCVFEKAQFAGLYADSSNTGSITDCIFRDNGQYGANMTGSSPVMLRCRFEANGDTSQTDFGGLNLVSSRGRVADCTFVNHADGGNAIALDNSITTVARDTFLTNAGIALFTKNGNNGPAVDSCVFSGGKIGASAAGPGTIRSCSFTDNAIGIEVIGNPTATIGGSLATGCTFRNNPVAVRDTVLGVLGVIAQYCDWGATSEDSVWALTRGGVGAAPWTDPTHTQVFTSPSYGIIEGSVTWSGQVLLRGDVYVAPGAHLTIDPGTVIRMQVPKASWDTLSTTTEGVAGECDLIVAGTLNALGGTTPGDSIIVTASDPTIGNGWGFIHFLEGSTATVIGTLVEDALVGFQADVCSPSFSQCTSRNNDDTGFRCQNGGAPLLSQCVAVNNSQIGIQVKDGTNAVVTGCSASGNANGLDVENSDATVTGCTFTANGNEGVVAVTFTGSLRGCTITSNGTYGLRCVNSPTATFGTQAEPNDISGSAFFNVFNASTNSVLQLAYTYWGATNEDAILSKLTGPVGYSPWYDATHTTLYTSTRFGTLAGNTTWSGATSLTGDVVVPAGVTLTVSPGAVIKSRTFFSAFDDPRGTPGLCDVIVDGTLKCSGTPSSKVTFTATFGSPGEWGRLLLLGAGNDSSRIEYTNVLAHSGMRMVDVTPWLYADSIGAAFDTSLAIVGSVPAGSNVGIASPAPSGGVGLALTGATGVLAGYRVSNGTTGVVVNGGAPSLTGMWVNNALTGVRFAGGTSAAILNSTTQSNKANGVGMLVTDASRPRVDVCVIKTTAVDTAAAIGLKVTGPSTRADLGGGRWGSGGGNAFIGFNAAPHYAVADSGVASDTTWAINTWWGTADEALVPARIIDTNDNASLGRVLYSPILLVDPTPVALWSLSRAGSGTPVLRWTGEPRTGVRVWRAEGTRGAAEWPGAFTEVGRAFTSARGEGEFADPAAQTGHAYTYALSSLADDSSGLLALMPVQWSGSRLALSIAPAGGAYAISMTMPEAGLAQVEALTADGRNAAHVWSGALPAGQTRLTWDASRVASGVYWFRLRTAAGDVGSRALIVR